MAHLSLAERLHLEMRAEGIDRLHTHTIQAHTLLEGLAVVLATSIEHADSLDKLALRNASAIIAHADTKIVLDDDFESLAGANLELVDGVVHHLYQEHLDAVFGQIAIAQTSDVHTRTGTYMLHITQVPDVVISILYCIVVFLCHIFLLYFFQDCYVVVLSRFTGSENL